MRLKDRLIESQENMRVQATVKRIAWAIEQHAPRHGQGFICLDPASCVTCAARHQAMESAAIARQVGGVTS